MRVGSCSFIGPSVKPSGSRSDRNHHSRLRPFFLAFAAIALLGPVLGGANVSAQEVPDEAAEILPASTILYLEVPSPADLIAQVVEHPLRERIEKLDAVRQGKRTPPYLAFVGFVAGLEAELEMKWPEIVREVAGQGAIVAFEPKDEGLLIGLHGEDGATQQQLIESLIRLVRLGRQGNDRDPVREATYRDLPVYRIGDARVTRVGDWIWITNQDSVGKGLIDALHDGTEDSLAGSEAFRTAAQTGRDHAIWSWGNLEALRERAGSEGIPDRTDNAIGELLIGGLIDLARHVPDLTLVADVNDQGLSLSAVTPFRSEWTSESREYWWGPEDRGQAPPRLAVAESLMQIEFHRDLSEMWLRAGDLYVDSTVDQFDQAESTLSTLFAGADFGEDILGAFAPTGHLIVARQTFDDPALVPDIRLPSFALVFEMEDAERMGPQLQQNFQDLIGFVNITGAMNGQPRLYQRSDSGDDWVLAIAEYRAQAGADRQAKPINYNFSPSLGFRGNRCVVASTAQLARQLVTADVGETSRSTAGVSNTTAIVESATLAAVLDDNRDQLIAQSMIDDGKTRDEATRDVGILIELLTWIDSATLDFSHGEDQAELKVDLKIAPPAESGR